MENEVVAREYDKSKWPDGPWMKEADRLQWSHAGLACLIVRGPLGALCGYVGIPSDHPCYQAHYEEVEVDVHGGLTYADKCRGSICHVPEPGMPDDVWWLGFDCAHSGDLVPCCTASFVGSRYLDHEVYRDIGYVTAEVNRLANQLQMDMYVSI